MPEAASNRPAPKASAVLWWIAGLAVAAGVYFRFKGLGKWPLAVDEYYLARSVDNVLKSGIPAYDCGGYYPRGLLFQYLLALMRMLGMTAELSARAVAALCSLAALPAVYLLGRRAHNATVGLLAVAFMALSVLEIEMARFGRMYAPFQAIFLWYLVFFLKYTVDGNRRALWGMLGLTILGSLTWEGGVFLALANLLPPFLNRHSGTLQREHWKYLIGVALLVPPAAFLSLADVRIIGSVPQYAADFDRLEMTREQMKLIDTIAPWTTIGSHPAWLGLALVPLALAGWSVQWIWSLRQRWLLALGLVVALAAALLHQFLLTGIVLVVLMVFGLIDWREFVDRSARPFLAAILSCAAFWTAFGLLTQDWRNDIPATWLSSNRVVLLAYEFLRFPEILRDIVRPWVRTTPFLALGLGALLAAAVVHVIRRPARTQPMVVLIAVLLCLVVLAGAAEPPRILTRYTYFLYPLAMLLALALIANLLDRWIRVPARAAIALVLIGGTAFALSEDFQPRHLARIDSAEVNFRIGMKPMVAAHYHPRTDNRSAADWLEAHTVPADVVINAFPSVDFYFNSFDHAYIDRSNHRYAAYACERGTVERWGNLPLLSRIPEISALVRSGQRVFMVVDAPTYKELQSDLEALAPQIEWQSIEGNIVIVSLH